MNNEKWVYLSSENCSSIRVYCQSLNDGDSTQHRYVFLPWNAAPLAFDSSKSWWFFRLSLNLIWIQFCPIHLGNFHSMLNIVRTWGKKKIFLKTWDLRTKPKTWFYVEQQMVQNFTISRRINKMEKLFLNYQQTHHICQMRKKNYKCAQFVVFSFDSVCLPSLPV